ncbi:hypothetical protein EVAR_7779_1 [Eumeta japonica]|uniref:Uncharacterized protein n=1 Tax=Eumeta variegata TaxID=151549 RepID=A0A4C1TME7_EUMVA|nr:hypothetical protein EVAR_7779_1 [Eumeta japonica]
MHFIMTLQFITKKQSDPTTEQPIHEYVTQTTLRSILACIYLPNYRERKKNYSSTTRTYARYLTVNIGLAWWPRTSRRLSTATSTGRPYGAHLLLALGRRSAPYMEPDRFVREIPWLCDLAEDSRVATPNEVEGKFGLCHLS